MTRYHTVQRRTYIRRHTRPRPRSRKSRAGRDRAYRAWILALPCLICEAHGFTQCTLGRGFAAYHGLDIEAAIVNLNERYRRYATLDAL